MLAISHETVSIPMKKNVESLNVAVTAGIVLACAGGVLPG
jgi:tRNA G18 (ribose-2'-O)-methylase SpoU